MKKIFFLIFVFLIALTLSSCSKINKNDAKNFAEDLIDYIEQGEYDFAAELFCNNIDNEGNTFPEFLDNAEKTMEIDFQSEITIVECIDYVSKYSGTHGTELCAFLDYNITIDGESANLYINLIDNNDVLQCFFFSLEYNDETYQYYCP